MEQKKSSICISYEASQILGEGPGLWTPGLHEKRSPASPAVPVEQRRLMTQTPAAGNRKCLIMSL